MTPNVEVTMHHAVRLLFGLLFAASPALSQARPDAREGVVDLTHWDAGQHPVLKLEGDARFYWNEFRVSAPKGESTAEPIRIQGSWHLNSKHPLFGYGTYELELVSDQERPITLDFGTVTTSYRIYVNDQLMDSNGVLGTSLETYEKGAARQSLLTVVVPKGKLRLSIEVANFEYMISGFVKPITLGVPEAVASQRYAGMTVALIVFGAYLAMALYHFGLYTLRRMDRSSLYFGLFCLAMLPATVVNMQVNVLELFTPVPLGLGVLLAASVGVASGFLGLFIDWLFQSPWCRRMGYVMLASEIVLIIAQAIDLRIFLVLLFAHVGVGIVLGCLIAYAMVRAVRKREPGALMIFVSILGLIIAAVNDAANFNGSIDSTPLQSYASLGFLMIQAYMLSIRFSNAFKQVEKLSEVVKAERDQVAALNENLEDLAEEKTRAIRSMMSHIQLGIFAITSEGRLIHPDYSQHLKVIFELDDLAGQDACQLLFNHCHLDADQRSQAESSIEAALGENELAFEMNAQCLPQNMRYTSPSGAEKLLELSWHPMVDDQGIIEKILVTVRDVTAVRALAVDAQDKKEELEFISELLNVTDVAFRRFLQDSHDFLAENRKLVNSQSILSRDLEILKVLFINMHTMKGTSRSLYLKKMTRVFHEVEQYYAQLQKEPLAHWDIAKMNADLDEAQKIISVYVTIYQNKLSRKITGERFIQLPESRIEVMYKGFVHATEKYQPGSEMQGFMTSMRDFFIEALFKSAKVCVLESCQFLGTLARDLKKEVPSVDVEATNLFLRQEGETLLRKIFVHILRNSMDHGIETPNERQQKGKSPAGCIRMSLQETDGLVHLCYQDDGRGLDLDRIRQVAIEKNWLKPSHIMKPEEIAELIFRSGLSTTSQVNDISGRGVGMDAVRSYLHEAGGTIAIRFLSPVQNGFVDFCFDITLPRRIFADAKVQGGFAAA